jgi:hypothetical protein
MAENSAMIAVEVAYARPDEQVIISLEVPPGTTLAQAILLSGLARRFPEIDLDTVKAGIYSKLSASSTVLCAGDRVEIYRPLSSDAKARRRQRAKAQRLPGAAGREPGPVAQD